MEEFGGSGGQRVDVGRQRGYFKALFVQETDEPHHGLASIRDHSQLQHGFGVEQFERAVGTLVFLG